MSEKNEKIRVLVVEPFEKPYVKEIGSTLEELQAQVGGNIEAVYPFDDPVAIICNEEGKIRDLPFSRGLYTEDGNLYDILCGRFLVTGITEDSIGSLPEELITKYEKLYHDPEAFISIDDHLQSFSLHDANRAADLAVQAMYLCEFSGYLEDVSKTDDNGIGKETGTHTNRERRYMESLLTGEDVELFRDLKEIKMKGGYWAHKAEKLLQKIEAFYDSRKLDRLEIYQIPDRDKQYRDYRFESYDRNLAKGFAFREENYNCVYRGVINKGESLDDIYERFNLSQPKNYRGHSLSVSDVVVMRKQGREKAFYVDSIGFKELERFRKEPEKAHMKSKESVLER